MITIDKVTYRNLQEQVQKNKEDIAAFEGVEFTLNNFGIKVIGKVDSSSDIPSGEYEYGDAYLVGTEQPYRMFIYTRNKEGEETGSFIDIGPLNIVGEQGEKGDKGDKGDDGYSPVVRIGTGLPVIESSDKEGYLYIDSNSSKLYTFTNNSWNYACDMLGKKGDRGEQGIQGATGTSLSIVGKLSDPSLLPTNFTTGSIPKNSAYLVTENSALHLYIILGDQDDYSTWYWQDVGDFNLGSMLYKNSNYMQTMDITDEYSTLTGALVTDIATSQLKNDVDTSIALKVDKTTYDSDMLKKATTTQVANLSNVVTTLSNLLNTETTNRTNADTTLTNNLSTETTNRIGGDSALETKIATEASTREKNDLPTYSNQTNFGCALLNCGGSLYQDGFAYVNDTTIVFGGRFIITNYSKTNGNAGLKFTFSTMSQNFTSSMTFNKFLAYRMSAAYEGSTICEAYPMFVVANPDTKEVLVRFNETWNNVTTNGVYYIIIPQTTIKYA